MNPREKSMKRVFWLLAMGFFLVLGSLGKLVLLDRENVMSNPYNPRLQSANLSLKRGEIRDANGEVLAVSVKQEDGSYERQYPRARMAAHITGYSSMGKTGLEASENHILQTAHQELVQRIRQLLTGEDVEGNNIALTVDMRIQSIAGDLLGENKGAIVALEPSTGRILALQAYPDFNPNTVAQDWDTLRENPNSPLLNRATQGLYPPGSTFKTVSALAAMRNLPDWATYTYTCTGKADFQDKVIQCYNGTAHGTIDLKTAMAVSCNTYFANLVHTIGAGALQSTATTLLFNEEYPFSLAHSQSRFSLTENATESELVETAIGQGKTLVTPLHMALWTAAIANDGQLMQPYLVDHVESAAGKVLSTTIPQKNKRLLSAEEANTLTDMMTEAVKNGTATAAAIEGIAVVGKTGTAQNATGKDHSWFIGFAPAEDPQVAVVVLLEDIEEAGRATPMAQEVMAAVLNQ